ncbi:MAG: AraC family transcriptional regulator [Microbacterium sp.]|uniref:AraC family transcriptional regulator n=1 Tax=Microbacterium sp. TaxID=51671 RepID=UPI0039E32E47
MTLTSLGCVVEENSVRFLGHDTHEHEVPHLVYAVSGEVVMSADGQEHRLRPGESIWLRPRVPHAVRVGTGGTVLGPMLAEGVEPATPVRALGVVPAIVEIMTTVLVAAPVTAEQVQPFRDALGTVLRNLSRQCFPVVLPLHPTARQLAREAVRSPLPLDALARRHHLSTRQVQRIFAAETGYSFARWRSRARLNAAASHLLGGGDVTAAARLSGFTTRAGLLRALSRETGLPTAAIALDPRGALAAA